MNGVERPQSPLLRELARRKDSAAGAQSHLPDYRLPSSLFPSWSKEPSDLADVAATRTDPDPIKSPIRIFRSRPANQTPPGGDALIGAEPNQLPLMDGSPSFDDRFGSWASTGDAAAPISPYQRFLPAPPSLGLLSRDAMPDHPFELPAFEDSTLGLDDWARFWARRSPWDSAR